MRYIVAGLSVTGLGIPALGLALALIFPNQQSTGVITVTATESRSCVDWAIRTVDGLPEHYDRDSVYTDLYRSCNSK